MILPTPLSSITRTRKVQGPGHEACLGLSAYVIRDFGNPARMADIRCCPQLNPFRPPSYRIDRRMQLYVTSASDHLHPQLRYLITSN